VSNAAVAMADGINANLARRWVLEAERRGGGALAKTSTDAVVGAFVPVQCKRAADFASSAGGARYTLPMKDGERPSFKNGLDSQQGSHEVMCKLCRRHLLHHNEQRGSATGASCLSWLRGREHHPHPDQQHPPIAPVVRARGCTMRPTPNGQVVS
jgi:hypothetical protein